MMLPLASSEVSVVGALCICASCMMHNCYTSLLKNEDGVERWKLFDAFTSNE